MNTTIEWLKRAENRDGGIAAWQNTNGSYHIPYPETSAYSIPTLLRWDAGALALRTADWLLRIQNNDGSFYGLDGIQHPFDVAAVIEGLEAAYKATDTAIYRYGAVQAKKWMESTIVKDGYLPDHPGNPEPRIYNLRASSIIGNRAELTYWQANGGLIRGQTRTHYLAYAIEGLMNFGAEEARIYLELAYHAGHLLQPFYVDENWNPMHVDFDICASCQMAILFKRAGYDVTEHYEAIQAHVHDDGGVPQSITDNRALSWSAKFWLDLVYEMEHDQPKKRGRKK